MQTQNSLFLGKEFVNLEGREIKHPATMNYYSSISMKKIKETPMKFISLDLETDSETAELKLLGQYDGEKYFWSDKDFIGVLFTAVKYASMNGLNLVYWSRLDPAVLYKQLLLKMDEHAQQISLSYYQKIDSQFNRKTKQWDIEPLAKTRISNYEFGIMKSIRSCLTFYYIDLYDDKRYLNKVWTFDIYPFYLKPLETVGKKYTNYYSKIDKLAHLVNWAMFYKNEFENVTVEKRLFQIGEYREMVLKSNELDCKVAYDLANIVQNDFFTAFGYYPSSLISPGSLTRSCYQAVITNKWKNIKNDKEREKKIVDDLKSISIMNHYDNWCNQLGEEDFKDFVCLIAECYKGAKIECYANGFVEKGFTADLTQAYPSKQRKLLDLRKSLIIQGEGVPQKIDNSITLIRGTVHIPDNKFAEYHTILIKHPFCKALNICAIEDFRASYYLEEREALERIGATFENEEWYVIVTEGKLSILAEITDKLIDLRMGYLAKKDLKEALVKCINNSGYGVSYEAIPIYDLINGEVLMNGFRAGEFFNDLNAGQITMNTRLILFNACVEIVRNGGKPILTMTDSVLWTGKETDLPHEFWTEKKTVGFFERPEEVREVVSLGSGRYEYRRYNDETKQWDKYYAKTRGLNIIDLTDSDGIVISKFNWYKLLKEVKNPEGEKLQLKVRILITPGVVANSNKWKVKDLGLVATDDREVDIIVGRQKRHIKELDYTKLWKELYFSEPIKMTFGCDGSGDFSDHTLPMFRKLVAELKYMSKEEKKKVNDKKKTEKYYDKNKEEVKEKYNSKYSMLRKRGLDTDTAKKMAGWKINKIYEWFKTN